MDLGRLGVWYAADKLTPPEWADLVSTSETLGYGTVWYSESRGYESMSLAAYLLSCGDRINVGSSIANIYARDAAAARAGMRTLGAISRGRFILGLGVSHPPLVEGFRGHAYGKPVTTMREYLDAMDDGEGAAAGWPVALGALGPRMLALAGARTRGALPYNVTPEHTARAAAILGPDRWLAVEQKVCLETDPSTARGLARAELERYMSLENYRNCWKSLGFEDEDLERGGSARFLDAMVVWGGVQSIEARIMEHIDAGATHVCIQPVHPPGDFGAAKRTLEALAPGL